MGAGDETPDGGIDPKGAQHIVELASGCDAVLIGPGMIDARSVAALTKLLLEAAEKPILVLDASAFTTLDRSALSRRNAGRVVVTPHSGEMAGFLKIDREEVESNPPDFACRVSQDIQAVVALKGAVTHIASPDGTIWRSDHGSIGLATSGSGDVLAGILAGLLARGTDPTLATIWSVYLHGEAGRRLTSRLGRYGLLARELPGEIPAIMHELSEG